MLFHSFITFFLSYLLLKILMSVESSSISHYHNDVFVSHYWQWSSWSNAWTTNALCVVKWLLRPVRITRQVWGRELYWCTHVLALYFTPSMFLLSFIDSPCFIVFCCLFFDGFPLFYAIFFSWPDLLKPIRPYVAFSNHLGNVFPLALVLSIEEFYADMTHPDDSRVLNHAVRISEGFESVSQLSFGLRCQGSYFTAESLNSNFLILYYLYESGFPLLNWPGLKCS